MDLEKSTITEYLNRLVEIAGKQSAISRFEIMLNGLNQHISYNNITASSVLTDIPIVLQCIINELNKREEKY